jgi:Ferredoxin
MAVKENKVAENVRGKFYVDDQCIACGLCREIAPEFFGNIENSDNSFVKKQPTSDKEIDVCMEALESCPVSAIGDDGE